MFKNKKKKRKKKKKEKEKLILAILRGYLNFQLNIKRKARDSRKLCLRSNCKALNAHTHDDTVCRCHVKFRESFSLKAFVLEDATSMQSYSKYSKSIQLHRLHHVGREIFSKIEEMENTTFTMKSHYILLNTFDYHFLFILNNREDIFLINC